MPAKSKAQQRLMAAAAHGATFPAAREIQGSMTIGQMLDFARGPMAGKPAHVLKAKPAGHAQPHKHPHRNLGNYLHKPKGR